jgi:hypothetical protein
MSDRNMNIDFGTYASKSFIRFAARNQLQADLTGCPVTVVIQRSGRDRLSQEFIPDTAIEEGDQPKGIELQSNSQPEQVIDERLFKEITQTTFSCHPELYESCGTQSAAKELEDRITIELLAKYKQVKLIQNSLNQLL